MTKQQAIDDLIASYVNTFGEQPDNVTGMVINTSAQRVVDGEWFRWIQKGLLRKIEWNPTDENLKCMQPGFIQGVIAKANEEPKVHCWSVGDQPDWEFIKDAIWFHGFHCNMVAVETNSDDLCIVIGPKEMTNAQAKEAYDQQNEIG